ncbi:MAG: hypothetical protein REI78_02260 [Pedobacter sp.]|nr:hypothetical protein [Pedobacter sp.]
MGLDLNWQQDFLLAVHQFNPSATFLTVDHYQLVDCGKVLVNLVPISNSYSPEQLLNLQATYAENGNLLVQLWEDVWLTKRPQVLARIRSFLGLNSSFHGRKTRVALICQAESSAFMANHHLQGYVKAKYHYGLFDQHKLIAAASFSGPRPMKSKGEHYRSAELVRFASVAGITIVGGLSKLIRHYISQVKVDDVMTYADRDWSLGKGYDRLNFHYSGMVKPQALYLDLNQMIRYFPHRLPQEILMAHSAKNDLNLDDFLLRKGFAKIFNTGNLKYHLYQI